MRRPVAFLAALLALIGTALAASTPPPSPNLPGRNFAGVGPNYITPADSSPVARGGAERGPALYTVETQSPNSHIFTIHSTFTLDVSITAPTGQNVVTLTSPTTGPTGAFVLPDLPLEPFFGYFAIIPGGGVSGATLTSGVTSINQAAGTITLSSNITNTNGVTGPITLTIQPTTGRDSPNHWTYYRSISISGSTVLGPNSSGTIPGSTITTASGTFTQFTSLVGDYVQVTEGGVVHAVKVVSQPDSAGATITVAPPLPALTTTIEQMWIGPVLFGSNSLNQIVNDVGNYIEVPGANTIGETGGYLTSAIATVSDPLNITMVTAAGQSTIQAGGGATALNAQAGVLKKGPDDTAAILALATMAIGQNTDLIGHGAKGGGYRYGYLVGNYYLPTLGAVGDLMQNSLCGEGELYFPANSGVYHGLTPCNAVYHGSQPDPNAIIPVLNLKESRTQTSALVFDFVGDSQFDTFTNGNGQASVLPVYLCDRLRRQNPFPKTTNNSCQYKAIGGTDWGMISPNGQVYCASGGSSSCTSPAAAAGIPMPTLSGAAASYPWYNDLTQPWLSHYVCNDHPDVIFFEFTNVGASTFQYGAMVDTVAYTQTTAWASACGGKNPDIIFVINGWQQPDPGTAQGNVSYEWGNFVASSIMRGYALGGNYTLANGGRIGVIDIARLWHIVEDGFDDEDMPLALDWTQVPEGAGPLVLPYTWGRAVVDFEHGGNLVTLSGMTNVAGNTPAQNAAQWWAVFNNRINIKVGAGDLVSPGTEGPTTYTGGVTTSYPNQQLGLEYDTNTGNLAYEYDPYVITTAANCSGTSGATTITCSTAQFNNGVLQGTLYAPTGASGGGTLVTTILNVNANGLTVSIPSPGVGATFTNQVITIIGPGGITPATFVGTGSGANLTVTNVVGGTLRPNYAIAGSGVPAGTTIVSQTSGPIGGAGVYVTSGATTSSGATLTSQPETTTPAVPCQTNSSNGTVTMCWDLYARGTSLGIQWDNAVTGPFQHGDDFAFQVDVPRFRVPFFPVISTPAGALTRSNLGWQFLSRGGINGTPSSLFADYTLGLWRPTVTMLDAYGPTFTDTGNQTVGAGPFAGQGSNHRGHLGAVEIDGPAVGVLNLSTY
jgi:hypothetical protein